MKTHVCLKRSPFCLASRPLDLLLADEGCVRGEGTTAAVTEGLTSVGRLVSSVFTVTLPACGDGGGLLLLDLGERKRSPFVVVVACCHREILKGHRVVYFRVLYLVVHISLYVCAESRCPLSVGVLRRSNNRVSIAYLNCCHCPLVFSEDLNYCISALSIPDPVFLLLVQGKVHS